MQIISSLRNSLLIATPVMHDLHFNRTVTLICQHDEQGAFGVTVNRPLDVTVGELLQQLNIDVESPEIGSQSALSGGPVQPEQGFVLHCTGEQVWESTLQIDDEVGITSSRDILVDIAKGQGPKRFLLVLGCAGWGSGQLEAELKENAWLTCPSDSRILFDMPYPQRWKGAASLLGIDMSLLSPAAGHA
ncbi:MAG: YqgE/AlgH family protein [Thiothrix sp.]|nr:YqgE/AlgH family protein [Thiothrix sp.]HPE59388.1 YqgE/AlgH family protein [Thiolinea sp.]